MQKISTIRPAVPKIKNQKRKLACEVARNDAPQCIVDCPLHNWYPITHYVRRKSVVPFMRHWSNLYAYARTLNPALKYDHPLPGGRQIAGQIASQIAFKWSQPTPLLGYCNCNYFNSCHVAHDSRHLCAAVIHVRSEQSMHYGRSWTASFEFFATYHVSDRH